MIICTIILIAAFAGIHYYTYRKLCKRIDERRGNSPAAVSNKAPETPDDKASNAERLYMEGIQSVLTFDVETAKKFYRGEVED